MKTITVILVDPCLTEVIPPSSLASYNSFNGDGDVQPINVDPKISLTYQDVCVYSISTTVTKSLPAIPDISASIVSFNTINNKTYSAA